ncbi:hypothetical protein J437_LFUL000205 [Ladona fulva]|uniref:Uncharacterized protein n=1 Tax=Ladona fulva TaxID=123851 RepID=A0A8K0JV13_LADFU|nr:hypothetical protein J437_LFUL000205 [Ladona fulva]
MVQCYMQPILRYGLEAATFNKKQLDRLEVMERWCHRRMLKVKGAEEEEEQLVSKFLRLDWYNFNSKTAETISTRTQRLMPM